MKVTQHLWFEKDMEAAIAFYVSLVPGSRLNGVSAVPGDGILHERVHAGSNSMRRLRGLNSSAWRPATRSAQGSMRKNRWE